jgi:hypothetical protein
MTIVANGEFCKRLKRQNDLVLYQMGSTYYYCVINRLQKVTKVAYAGCRENAPSPNIEARFRAYAEKLSTALGHADRVEPFQAYCTGLLLPIERKSVEPMAARLAPGHVSAKHQSLHHFVAKAPEVAAPRSRAHSGECYTSSSGFTR